MKSSVKVTFSVFTIILVGLCIFISIQLSELRTIKNECRDMYFRCDSLEHLSILKIDEQSPYYGQPKDVVLSMLPTPKSHSDVCLTDGMYLESHGLYDKYFERIKDTNDTIKVEVCSWRFPDKDSTRLFIVFEQDKDSVWTATSCLEWASDIIYLD